MLIIEGKRIRSLGRHLRGVKLGTTVAFAVPLADTPVETLEKIGLGSRPSEGEVVLPAPLFGPVSRFNADGGEIVHKDQPMETAYRQAEWHWTEWHGDYPVEQSKIVDVPYQRYPRTFLPPPSVELQVKRDADERLLVVTPPIEYAEDNSGRLLHLINLMLELFGSCIVVSEELESLSVPSFRRLNWEVLPRGRRPWSELEEQVGGIIQEAPQGSQPVITHRLENVNGYEPEFVAVGRAGFRGYFVFGFPDKGLYVLESAFTGNATYVFGEEWERLSRLTKAEILSDDLQEDRVIHREGWEARIGSLLG